MVDGNEAAAFQRDLETVLQTDKINKDAEFRTLVDTYALALGAEFMKIAERVAVEQNLHWPGVEGNLELVMTREHVFAIERETTISNLEDGLKGLILAEVHRLRKTGRSAHDGSDIKDSITNEIIQSFGVKGVIVPESLVKGIVRDVYIAIDETRQVAKLAVNANSIDKAALCGLIDKYWWILGDDVIELIKDRYRRHGFTYRGIVPYLKERLRMNREMDLSQSTEV
jgi:hypothetical protein